MRKLTRRQLRKLILREANILSERPADWNPADEPETHDKEGELQLVREIEKWAKAQTGRDGYYVPMGGSYSAPPWVWVVWKRLKLGAAANKRIKKAYSTGRITR